MTESPPLRSATFRMIRLGAIPIPLLYKREAGSDEIELALARRKEIETRKIEAKQTHVQRPGVH